MTYEELVAEVERLRADVVRRQELCDAYQSEYEAAHSALLESEAVARGNAEARIVTWLRRRRLDTREYDGSDNAVSLTLAVTADRIERGEHRREGEP